MKRSGILRWLGCLAVAAALSFIVQTDASAKTFTDVPTEHPYWKEIQHIESEGLINGYTDGSFRPKENISRKHVAKLLSNALNLKSTSSGINYKDVPRSHPYYEDISKVSQAGIFSGDINGEFNPDAPLTRVQMAKVLDISFKLNIKSMDYFDDVYWDHWGLLHVQALLSNKITTGDNGNFRPNQSVTRAHYAVFLSRALKNPGLPDANANSILTKAEIVNLIHRVPNSIETTLVKNKIQKTAFNTVRKIILNDATTQLTDGLLKSYYADMCTECDGYLFSYLGDEMDYRFEIVENTATSITIRTVTFDVPGPTATGEFLEYSFEKKAGKWKLAEFNWEPIGADSLELTKEEAAQIIKNSYEKQSATSVRVTYVGSGYEDVYELSTDLEYRRVVYTFDVTGSFGTDRVSFYPHNGRQE